MKKTFTIIYSIFVSLILIFSITYFAVNIYNENAHGDLRTQVRFEKVVNGVKTAFEKNNISASEKSRLIENAIGDTNDFTFIKITCDSKALYTFPENLDSLENSSSKLVIPYSRNLNINGSIISINCGMYSLRPSSIFEHAKISFFIILIVTLLTIILIIYNNHFAKDKNKIIKIKRSNTKIIDKEVDDEIDSQTEMADENEDSDPDEIHEEENDYVEENPEEEIVANIEDEKTSAEIQKTPDDTIAAELPVEDFEPVEIKKEEAPAQNGLFSPDTGLGWESYLMTRLENELNRATASELDLALFVIKIQGLDRKNPLMKKICEFLTVEFQFKDLLFEYKDDSICGMKISMDIDNAINFAEKLVSEIKNIAGQECKRVLAGLTSRGIRMVSGERLLKEADEAVKHAEQDMDNPVVGFRADAVKYRKFLEKN